MRWYLLLSIITIALAASWYVYKICFYSPARKHPTPDEPLRGDAYESVAENLHRISGIMQRIPCEDVFIKSYDGTRLHGRYYHVCDGAPVEILFHGYRSHPFRDCSGGHALSRKMGFNALVVDQRAHGESGGHTISFGIKEHRDCLCWIQYLNRRFVSHPPVILCGLSMGAATVLMSAKLELPENVKCIIADSPYSAPSAIIEKVCTDRHYPVPLCRPIIHLAALLLGGFRLNGCTASEAVTHARVPILLIHGEADDFVPCTMTLDIAAHCASPVEVVTFPGAGHGLSYMTDPVRYELAILLFLQKIPAISLAIKPEYITDLRRNIRD